MQKNMEACYIATKFQSIALLTQPQRKFKVEVRPTSRFFCYCPPITICKLSASPVNQVWPRSYVNAYAASCSCSNNDNSFSVQGDAEVGHDRTVRVKLILVKECEFGEEFSAVGEEPILGLWNPRSAIPMTWSPGHIWATPTMDLPVGKRIYFKFILTDKEGEIQWQPGPDRVLETWETRAILLVSQDWDDINLQTITEEEMDEQVIKVIQQEIAENEQVITAIRQEITETGIEDWVGETLEAGVGIAEGGDISGEAPVLVPGLTSGSDADGDCLTTGEVPVLVPELTSSSDADGDYSTTEEVPVLVPGLTTVFDAHGDCLAKEIENAGKSSVAIMAAEEDEEEEESSLFVENGSATLNNHVSLSGENEASTSSATETSVVVEEEETSISSAKELIENKDTAALSESSCNEGEHSNTVNYESNPSIVEKDFDWGRAALSKLMWSLGLKND